MQKLGRCDNVVTSRITPRELVARLALQGTLNDGPGSRVIHVGELDRIDASRRLVGIDEAVGTAACKVPPLKVGRDALDRSEHVVMQRAGLLALPTGQLSKGLHGLLENLDNMGLKGLEVILHGNEIVSVVVLGDDLSV